MHCSQSARPHKTNNNKLAVFLEKTSIGMFANLLFSDSLLKWQYDTETVFSVAVVDFRVEINVFRTHSSTGIPAKRSGRRVSTLVGDYIFTLTSIVPPLQRILVVVFVRQSSTTKFVLV